jgi:hypothetical protein
MSERHIIEIGTFPIANEVFNVGDDVIAALLREADRKLEVEREDEARQRQAAIADVERVKATRRARSMRHIRKVLRLCLR